MTVTFQTLLHSVQHYKLLTPGTHVLLAVSGGADSLVLMDMMSKLQDDLLIQLTVASLDHGLRGYEGADDVNFVIEQATHRNLEVISGKADVAALAQEWNTGLEAAARRARYDFLARAARQAGASRVATAHHADDQTETILMHILRGSGLRGLRGMAWQSPLPGHPDLILIRPMLSLTREQVTAYCEAHGLSPRHDASNTDTQFLRNRIRLDMVPRLEMINPRLKTSLANLADIVAVEQDFIQQQFDLQVRPHMSMANNRISVTRTVFAALHPALQRETVRFATGQLAPDQTIGYEHIRDAVTIGTEGETGDLAVMPGSIRLRVDYSQIVIEHSTEALPTGDYLQLPQARVYAISPPDHLSFPEQGWQITISPTRPNKPSFELRIPDTGQLTLRTRRPGDRIQTGGHHKKLKKWLIDSKVPQHLRDHLPLLTIDDEIACILLKHHLVQLTQAVRTSADDTQSIYVSLMEGPLG